MCRSSTTWRQFFSDTNIKVAFCYIYHFIIQLGFNPGVIKLTISKNGCQIWVRLTNLSYTFTVSSLFSFTHPADWTKSVYIWTLLHWIALLYFLGTASERPISLNTHLKIKPSYSDCSYFMRCRDNLPYILYIPADLLRISIPGKFQPTGSYNNVDKSGQCQRQSL